MFTEESFQVFQVEGLEPRMTAIRSEIQPVFQKNRGDHLSQIERNPREPLLPPYCPASPA